MNYKIIYQNLIQNRKLKGIITGYKEKHHIIPKSFGGSNDSSNLIYLTAREHFIAHLLLARIYPNSGMVHAAYKMACLFRNNKKVKITNRIYETLREKHAYRVSTDEISKKKKSIATKGRKQTKEHIKARVESRKQNGKWLSEETIEKIKIANLGNKFPNRNKGSNRTQAEINGAKKSSESRKGRKMLPEQVAKSIASRKGKSVNRKPLSDDQKENLRIEKSKKITCPHCGKTGTVIIMPRWHFDNCKFRVQE